MADADLASKEKMEKASSKGKVPAKKSSETAEKVKKLSETNEKTGTSKSSSSKGSKPNREDEMMNILLSVRAEQLAASQKLDSFEKRLTGLESYGYEQNEYEYCDDQAERFCSFVDDDGDQSVVDQTPSEVSGSSNKRKNEDENNNASRFAQLGKKFKAQEICDADVDVELAENVDVLFREGIPKEKYDEMVKAVENSRPQNCQGLVTVRLNQLIYDIVSPAARTRDGKIKSVETTMVKAESILTKTVDKADKMDKDCKLNGGEFDAGSVIDRCNDAIALLGHANTQINMLRRDLLKPEMRNEYSHLCTHSLPFTDQLFGDDVSKTAKEIEESSRMGQKLQYSPYNPYRGNWRGRGGFNRGRPRGGFSRGSRGGRGGLDFGHTNVPKNSQRQRGGARRM